MSKESDLEQRINREVEFHQMKSDIKELREWREKCEQAAWWFLGKILMYCLGVIFLGTTLGSHMGKARDWLLEKLL